MATGDIELPENMRLVQQGSHLEIVWRWGNLPNLPALGIAMAVGSWLVGSNLRTIESSLAGVLDGARSVIDEPFPRNLFGPVVACFVVLFLYSITAQLFNRTRISVSHARIVVRHGPLPWLGNRELETSKIKQIFTRINPDRSTNTPVSISYEVLALTRNGDTIKLLSVIGLTSEQASFIERKLEASLGIRDTSPGT